MADPPNDPNIPQCTARSSRTGNRCNNRPIKGGTVCRNHGGANPKVRAKANQRLATEQARQAAMKVGVLVVTSPQQALLDEVHRAAGMVAFYGARVAEVDADARDGLVAGVTRVEERTGFQPGRSQTLEAVPNVWLRLWNDERDRLTRVSGVAIKAGIEERRVLLAEQQGQLVAVVIRRVLDRLGLSDVQRVLVGTVVPDELRALTVGVE